MAEYVWGSVHFTYDLFIPGTGQALLPLVVYLKADDVDEGAVHFTGAENQRENPPLCSLRRRWTGRSRKTRRRFSV